ncbi:MAG TPA: indole-3-glycerol phosphate synthase TrpC [Phycisphaerae bacterium]|nr:indole-3-glycerol phosphate synthase TrpC [Phycisphaerae bacterium]
MSDILAQIIARKRETVAHRRRTRPIESLRRVLPAGKPRGFAAAMRRPGLSVIAEFKRRSPSRGDIAPDRDVLAVSREYGEAGAAALSILTEEDFFGGSDDDLRRARAAVEVPVLRKDFTVDAYQVYEARALGADAILLIVACLEHALLRELLAIAAELHLAALVEIHDETQLERAHAAGATIIGVNNRDLRTFEVSLETSLRLRPRMPPGCIAVAESGIRTGDDARRLADAGFDAILVGESLLRAPDAGAKLRELGALARRPE